MHTTTQSARVSIDDLNMAAPFVDPGRRKKTVESPYLQKLQLRHFVLFDVLPAFGTIAAIALLPVMPVGPLEIAMGFVLYLVSGIGVTAGYHRLFAHRSYNAAPSVRIALTILGSIAAQGPVVSWVALHRRHHEFSDKPSDPHSPNLHGSGFFNKLRGLVHAHYTWMARHEYPSVVHYTPDLLRDRPLMWANQRYFQWVAIGLLLPALIGAAVSRTWQGALLGFLWAGMVRIFISGHIVWSINSFLHMFGPRAFPTREHSRNNGLLSLISFGESWHNNHHAFPNSARFGLLRFQLDPGWWAIQSLERAGLAWNVRVPTAERIERRRREGTPEQHAEDYE